MQALLASQQREADEQQALLEEAESALSFQRKEASDKEEELAVREGGSISGWAGCEWSCPARFVE
jgi:hypothetical protein